MLFFTKFLKLDPDSASAKNECGSVALVLTVFRVKRIFFITKLKSTVLHLSEPDQPIITCTLFVELSFFNEIS